MTAVLKENYINTWVLLDDIRVIIAEAEAKPAAALIALSADAQNELRLAKLLMAAYAFPVENMVFTPDGELVWRLNINHEFDGVDNLMVRDEHANLKLNETALRESYDMNDFDEFIAEDAQGGTSITDEEKETFFQLKVETYKLALPPAGEQVKAFVTRHKGFKTSAMPGKRDAYVHMFAYAASPAALAQPINLAREVQVGKEILALEDKYLGLQIFGAHGGDFGDEGGDGRPPPDEGEDEEEDVGPSGTRHSHDHVEF